MTDASPDPAAELLAGDESALMLMQAYSKACAAFAHAPGQENAFAMDAARERLLNHAAQRERSISAAIDRLVAAAMWAGATCASTGETTEAHAASKQREAELRAIIGVP